MYLDEVKEDDKLIDARKSDSVVSRLLRFRKSFFLETQVVLYCSGGDIRNFRHHVTFVWVLFG